MLHDPLITLVTKAEALSLPQLKTSHIVPDKISHVARGTLEVFTDYTNREAIWPSGARLTVAFS
jgi:hypothetical protein